MALDKITDAQMDAQGVIAAPDILEGQPSETKAIFDRLVRQVVAMAVNQVIDEVNAHETDTENPHSVTKEQAGLGNADNTADADKPVSTPQAVALALKADVSAVLTKTNAAEFSPTADYHPATKKYVDETAAGAVMGQIPDESLTTQKIADGAVTTEKLSDGAKTWEAVTEKPSSFTPSAHAATHKTGGTDAMAAGDIDAATKPAIVIVTFPVAGWTQNATTGCYEQTVAVAGLLTMDSKNVRVEPVGNDSDSDAQKLTDASFAMIDRVSCDTDGQLYARCPDGAPTIAFQAAVVISR